MKVWESVSIKSVRGRSVQWGGDWVGGEWPFFVKASDFSRKDAMACMPSLTRPLSCTRLFKRCNGCRWETWTKWILFLRKRNEVFRYTPSKETTTIWPLSDLSTDLLVGSRNQLGKRATCPFILFIENSSHICYAVRMANLNFLAQPIIITILYSLRFSRQNKSSSSTWCQSLSSLNGMVAWVNMYGLRAGCEWYVKGMSVEQ